MEIHEQVNPELEKVAEIVKKTQFAMLSTVDDDGRLRSRPMATMEMDMQGNLWFFTSVSSPKAFEINEEHQVNLSYARTDIQDYLSISGRASIVRDHEKIKQLWTPWIKPWFPNGLDDADLVLLKVSIEEAEYWDAPGSAAQRFMGMTKAMVTGNTDGLGENQKIRLN